MSEYEVFILVACIALGALFLVFHQRRQAKSSKAESQKIDAAEIRRRRFEKLSTPGDLDQSWKERFVSGGLGTALRTWRSLEFPATLFMIVIEDDGVASRKLQQYVWASPDLAKVISPRPTTADEVLAVRCQAGSRDTAFVQEAFHLSKDMNQKLPIMFFLYGKPEIRMYQPHPNADLTSQFFLQILKDLHAQRAQDWEALGWVANDGSRQTPMDLKALEQLRQVRELHRIMAENLIAANSASTAKQLIGKGVVTLQDFVVEDVAVGLDTDVVAEDLKAQHISEQPEREALRREQEAELAASAAADQEAASLAADREAKLQAQEEEAEAVEVWRRFDREHKLSQLPEEPPADAPSEDVHVIVVVLPGGRRITRRWWSANHLRCIAEFAYGSALDSEILCYPPSLVCTFPRTRLENFDQSLKEAGLARQLLLHAAETLQDSAVQ